MEVMIFNRKRNKKIMEEAIFENLEKKNFELACKQINNYNKEYKTDLTFEDIKQMTRTKVNTSETAEAIKIFDLLRKDFKSDFIRVHTEFLKDSIEEGGFATAFIETEAQDFINNIINKAEKRIEELKDILYLNPFGKIDLQTMASERMKIKKANNKDEKKAELERKLDEIKQQIKEL